MLLVLLVALTLNHSIFRLEIVLNRNHFLFSFFSLMVKQCFLFFFKLKYLLLVFLSFLCFVRLSLPFLFSQLFLVLLYKLQPIHVLLFQIQCFGAQICFAKGNSQRNFGFKMDNEVTFGASSLHICEKSLVVVYSLD